MEKPTAIKFAEASDRLIITGRRKERLDDLTEHLVSNYGTEVLPSVLMSG
ncbi:MAG: hypothetical protein MZV63_27475 [Marinilabiliales bacterium]|nr:hypothetical protein [Marinilabiliales bacterium]